MPNLSQLSKLVNLAEDLSCDKLLAACAKYMTSLMRGSELDQGFLPRFCTQIVQANPKFAAALLMVSMS